MKRNYVYVSTGKNQTGTEISPFHYLAFLNSSHCVIIIFYHAVSVTLSLSARCKGIETCKVCTSQEYTESATTT